MKKTAAARVTRETKSMKVKEVYSEMCPRQQENKDKGRLKSPLPTLVVAETHPRFGWAGGICGNVMGLLVRVRLGDRPRIRRLGRTRAQVELRLDCPAPRGVGERSGPAGNSVSSRGSDHTLAAPTLALKLPTDGKEHAVLPVGPDNDCGAAKVPLIILDARQHPRDVSHVGRTARPVEVYLGQPARQLRHARDRSRGGGGE